MRTPHPNVIETIAVQLFEKAGVDPNYLMADSLRITTVGSDSVMICADAAILLSGAEFRDLMTGTQSTERES